MKKIKRLEKSSITSAILRALRLEKGFGLRLNFRSENQSDVSTYFPHYDFHRNLENAVLEAEQVKAKGIMGFQKYRLNQQ